MYDNIGSVRGLVDASGTVTDCYELDTFGRQVSSSGTTPEPVSVRRGLGLHHRSVGDAAAREQVLLAGVGEASSPTGPCVFQFGVVRLRQLEPPGLGRIPTGGTPFWGAACAIFVVGIVAIKALNTRSTPVI